MRQTVADLQDLLDCISDAVIAIGSDWRVLYQNRRVAELLPASTTLDLDFRRRFPELISGYAEWHYKRCLADGTPQEFDHYCEPVGRWLEIHCRPSPTGLVLQLRDVTTRRLDDYYSYPPPGRELGIVGASLDAIVTMDHIGCICDFNPAAERIFGYRARDILGKPLAGLIIPERLRGRLSEGLSQYVQTGQGLILDQRLELPALHCDGHEFPVEMSVSSIAGQDPPMFTATIRDITERSASEQELRRSQDELRTLADSIPQLAWMAQPDGHIFWYNQGWLDYTGTTSAQVEGWGWQACHEPQRLPAVVERWRECLSSGQPFEMEFPLRGADGSYRWFLTRANPVRDAQGQVLRWFGTSTDVDEVHRVRQALQDETRLLELLNQTGAAIASQLDLNELLQNVTDAGTQLSGAAFGAFFYTTYSQEGEAFLLYTLSGAPREAFESLGLPRATPIFGPTFRGEGPVRYDDVTRSESYGAMGPHHGMPPGHLPVRSYLAVPVKSRSGGTIGGLFFGHPQPGVFNARHERLLVGIAAQAAIAVDNARLYEDVKRAGVRREELLEAERAARSHFEHISLMKDEFLATLSHELRTPMNSILGWSQLVRSGGLEPDEVEQALETIERNARVQARLIEDLLDMSRILSGKLRLEKQPIALARVLASALESARPAAQERGVRLDVRIDEETALVLGDGGRLQQILGNLLSNAIKFTPPGGTIEVGLGVGSGELEVEVRDSGVGIAAEFLEFVFERFRQADSSSTRRHGGLGLGLSIVKQLVELHGGRVEAHSPGPDCGSTFRIYLPRLSVGSGLETGSLEEARTTDLSGIRVLVVDDHRDGRVLLARILRAQGARVMEAGSAPEALRRLETEALDLVLSDIGMPDMDGYELLRQICARGLGTLPTVAVTAFASAEDRERALQAGFRAHLAKPVDPAQLLATVSALMGR